MVRRTLNPSLLAASRCSWLVMKGASGRRCCSRACTLVTDQLAFSSAASTASIDFLVGQRARDELLFAVLVLAVGHARRLAFDADELRLELLDRPAFPDGAALPASNIPPAETRESRARVPQSGAAPRFARAPRKARGALYPTAAAKSGSPPADPARAASAARPQDSGRCPAHG